VADKSTIFAVSTGSGRAGIAVVRLSGPLAGTTLARLAGGLPKPRIASYRTLVSGRDGSPIDRALVLWLPGPGTVTGEDVAELHVHGSLAVQETLLRELAALDGLALAEAGAFTRRAFENGRLDLVEVEGLADLLAADTEAQRQLAMRQFSGEASSVYEQWRAQVVQAGAMIAAAIDFADEKGVAEAALKEAQHLVAALRNTLSEALRQSESSAAVRRGLRVTLAGPANAGKSSLLNALSRRDAAIVSPIAGTTRDVVEAAVVFDGLAVLLADTAGLRVADDHIEAEGVRRSMRSMAEADLLIWVTAPDCEGTAMPARSPDLIVHNKCDLVQSIQHRNERGALAISCKTGVGLEELRLRISALAAERVKAAPLGVMVRERHRHAVLESIRHLNDALAHDVGALELIGEDVRKAALALASVTGRVGVEDYLEQVFSSFCIGK
jgi:tRNA modification GTPase